jgi:hypothetical protein
MSTKSLIQQASSIEQAHTIAAARTLVTKVVWPASEIERVYKAAHTALVQVPKAKAAATPPKQPKRKFVPQPVALPIGLRCTLVPMNADLPALHEALSFQNVQHARKVRVHAVSPTLGQADSPVSLEAFSRFRASSRMSLAFKGEVYLARLVWNGTAR